MRFLIPVSTFLLVLLLNACTTTYHVRLGDPADLAAPEPATAPLRVYVADWKDTRSPQNRVHVGRVGQGLLDQKMGDVAVQPNQNLVRMMQASFTEGLQAAGHTVVDDPTKADVVLTGSLKGFQLRARLVDAPGGFAKIFIINYRAAVELTAAHGGEAEPVWTETIDHRLRNEKAHPIFSQGRIERYLSETTQQGIGETVENALRAFSTWQMAHGK
jgi:hypothetical protein